MVLNFSSDVNQRSSEASAKTEGAQATGGEADASEDGTLGRARANTVQLSITTDCIKVFASRGG